MKPRIWDYNLDNNWKPVTNSEWELYLIRKINYNDLTGIPKAKLKKHLPGIKKELDPGKFLLIDYYLKQSK
ncbi:hypothetical protein A3J20_02490 [Candidatus Gottesmanbacteria bacterium RIFCSPLOWO2_02_FULL_42_29]|uniref:Uncharacterized protein n=1 Tax=Candidatus Gottesmanbacteria bacterium RIFCSPLOWO2_01_FULL_42_22 TaxID=1798391 RepID=A0A1F6BB11_9BACT|nr:MAG: hypothetical protein A2781_03975 [Candidatus Gottesmanbacteria bacterium RIFCSPHIGHO2_01_FULL_42_27]OGG34151.1 MAG: hypothetical protein A2968_03180 [Candidatus Gottesmanbacteria bacterium RIFCSPLOWO2_01_FULL_42_22]OGG37927.1 MAG: hypothetical protein A3J20_02490 [Candidatus Gottesmanbacteria bacterium RIFCSPLOWO2_02_FULL_42_29]